MPACADRTPSLLYKQNHSLHTNLCCAYDTSLNKRLINEVNPIRNNLKRKQERK